VQDSRARADPPRTSMQAASSCGRSRPHARTLQAGTKALTPALAGRRIRPHLLAQASTQDLDVQRILPPVVDHAM